MKKNIERCLKKQKMIVNAVVDLMDEQGLKNVSVLDICAAAKVAVGTFYHYFPSKDHIELAMYDQLTDHMTRACAEELRDLPAPEAIVTFFDLYADYIFNWGKYANMLTARSSLENGYDCEQRETPLFDQLCAIITHGLEDGTLHSPLSADILTERLFVIARGCNFEWAKRGDNFLCAPCTHDIVSAYVAAITAKTEHT